jgi:hypothetical protein
MFVTTPVRISVLLKGWKAHCNPARFAVAKTRGAAAPARKPALPAPHQAVEPMAEFFVSTPTAGDYFARVAGLTSHDPTECGVRIRSFIGSGRGVRP